MSISRDMPHRATIQEVARLAGVSHQTVSRYLRHNGGLKAATFEAVDNAVKQLNYRPSPTARAMRTRRTGRLAILIPSQAIFSASRMLSGAAAVARDAGYVVEVLSVDGGAEGRTRRVLELADSGQVEGILSLAPLVPVADVTVPAGAALVVSADYDDEMHSIGELADGSPMAEIIEHLAALGHRRFVHLSGDLQFASARGRLQTYLATIERLGLESVGVLEGDWSPQSGVAAIGRLADDCGVTAVIAANDEIAAGAISAATARGWRVPDDLSVTGWNNDPIAAVLPPTLTSVAMDHELVGRRAMRRLLSTLTGVPTADDEPGNINTVIWRGSVGPPPTGQR
jgi:DNA-binding LacI/PurR family transcriptional regulator